jgi:uncharacterized membrane protein YbaN (DUF454 family)
LAAEMGDFGAFPRAQSQNRLMRALLIVTGSVLVGVGVLGIFLPLLPTTVFFLMAAGCYGKSSPGAYRWLTTNRWFGRYLREYREERGATIGTKVFSLGSLWLGIGASEYFFRDNLWVVAILFVVALAVSAHLLALNTIRRSAS